MIVQLRPLSLAKIRVVDAETGGPIANAKLSSGYFFDDGVSAVTGADGIARMNVQLPSIITVDATDYVVAREVLNNPKHAEGPRGFRDRATVIVGGGPDRPDSNIPAQVGLDVRLKRGIAVSGTVLGPDGHAVAGASVAIFGSDGTANLVDVTTRTDASGRFATYVPAAGRYAISADRRDLTTRSFPVPRVQRLGTVAVEIPVEGRADLVAHVVVPRGEIRGTVVDLSSKPVAGARVSVADGTHRPVVADAKGRFVIENVDGAVDLIANRGSEASAFHRVQVKSGEGVDVELQIGPTGIAGIAVDHDGAPVAGADIWLNPSGLFVPGTRFTTDASGRFSFDTPRGDFVLSVRRYEDDDYEDEDDLKVIGGSHDVRLVVP